MHSNPGGAQIGAASKKFGLAKLALAALPAIAVVNTGMNGLVIGAGVLVTAVGASLLLSAIWKFIREEHRGFAFWLFAATVASMTQMVLAVAQPRLASPLGLYMTLVPFVCALTAYPEVYDEDRETEDSLVHALARGALYLVALTVIGCLREVLGSGAVFGAKLGEAFQPMRMLTVAPGGFLIAGVILAIVRACMPGRGKGGEDA